MQTQTDTGVRLARVERENVCGRAEALEKPLRLENTEIRREKTEAAGWWGLTPDRSFGRGAAGRPVRARGHSARLPPPPQSRPAGESVG